MDAPRLLHPLNGTARAAQRLGVLVSGSLAEGLAARVDAGVSLEDIRIGKFVKIAGRKYEYFCLVTNVALDSANPDVLRDPPAAPDDADQFLRDVLNGTTTFGIVKIKPELMLANLASDEPPDDDALVPRPARTIPPHFAIVFEASRTDFERVFGAEGGDNFFIGQPIDMDVPVCLNLPRFVQRSNGVFGKSGTGKSFLTRLVLCGVIQSAAAVNLVFDMHSEYGWSSGTEDGSGGQVKGLQQLFPSQVQVYTLDRESARGRQVKPDGEVRIALGEITVEDITLLQDELKLNRTAAESAAVCVEELGREWPRRLLEMSGDEVRDLADRSGGNQHSLNALRSKLRLIDQLPFVDRALARSSLDQLIAALESGRHVVLEFGRQKSLLAYILVANVITRRLHDLWVRKTEAFLSSQQAADRPPQLMITVEEAHRFLGTEAARQTTFGTIARELRKFYVTLLVVDQRPSGIDSEVLSQIGTRITCQLNDDRDIEAIFTGVSGGSHLRTVLSTLDSRQQALILGHAVPMPVVVRTRPYDETFYQAIARGSGGGAPNLRALTSDDPASVYDRLWPSDDD